MGYVYICIHQCCLALGGIRKPNSVEKLVHRRGMAHLALRILRILSAREEDYTDSMTEYIFQLWMPIFKLKGLIFNTLISCSKEILMVLI